MIYLEHDSSGTVTIKNYLPFHEVHGYGKTQDELEETGILVESIPVPEEVDGQISILKINLETKNLYYGYEDAPLPEVERTPENVYSVIQREVNELKQNQKTDTQKFLELDKETTSLADLKIAKILELKELCTQAIYDGFSSTTGHEFGFNDLDQANFTQQSILILINGLADTATLKWKTKTGVVTLTVAEFKTVITEAKDHKLAQQGKFWQLEGQTLAATTKTAIEAVKW